MSSKNNVNPGQYKTRGSLRQGEDVIHDVQKKEFTQAVSPDKDQDASKSPNAADFVKVKPKQAKRSQAGR